MHTNVPSRTRPCQLQSPRFSRGLLVSALFAYTLLVSGGCEERQVPVVVDEDEIVRYINNTEEGIELFGVSELIGDEGFALSDDPGATYRILTDSTVRTISVNVTSESAGKRFKNNILPPANGINGWRDAEAEVVTRLFIKLLRISGTDTTRTAYNFLFRRYGWFVKLGGDNRPFLGWSLEGYSGGGTFLPSRCSLLVSPIYKLPGDSVPMVRFAYDLYSGGVLQSANQITDYAYFRLGDTTRLARLQEGTAMELELEATPSNSYFALASFNSTAGVVGQKMSGPTSGRYTLNLSVPSPATRLWNPIGILEVRRSQITNDLIFKLWQVPYRVPL